MLPKYRRMPWWLAQVAGKDRFLTIHPWIFTPYSQPTITVEPKIQRHEEHHWRRQKAMGLLNYAFHYAKSILWRLEEEAWATACAVKGLNEQDTKYEINYIASDFAQGFYGWFGGRLPYLFVVFEINLMIKEGKGDEAGNA